MINTGYDQIGANYTNSSSNEKKKERKFRVDYNELSKFIYKSTMPSSSISTPEADDLEETLSFFIDKSKLAELIKPLGLTPIGLWLTLNKRFCSWVISQNEIILLDNILGEKTVKWLGNELKRGYPNTPYISIILFKQKDEDESNPTFQDVYLYKPCYVATIISYRSNNPHKLWDIGYDINIRANRLMLSNKELFLADVDEK